MGGVINSLVSHRLEGAASGEKVLATTADFARLGLQIALSWCQAVAKIWVRQLS